MSNSNQHKTSNTKAIGLLLLPIIGLALIVGLIYILISFMDKEDSPSKVEQVTSETYKPDLNATVVTYPSPENTIKISNNEDTDWLKCTININNQYEYLHADIPKRSSITINLGDFSTSNGTRLNPDQIKAKDIKISSCIDSNSGRSITLKGH